MLIQDRIRLIMKSNHLNASQFAEAIGVKPANLSHVLSGRNKPSMDFLEKVVEHFPRVNAAWLLTGIARAEEENVSSPQMTAMQNHEQLVSEIEIERIVVFYQNGTFKEYRSMLDHSTSN